jgi:hypothetical protein
MSMLAYTEHTFGLTPLTSADANAYDYGNSFNYAQTPRGPVAMTHRALPAWERLWIASHPPDPDDPT